MNTLLRSEVFTAWLKNLRDQRGKARVLSRLDSAALGNFGDCEYVGERVFEMRSQKRDIAAAIKMARQL